MTDNYDLAIFGSSAASRLLAFGLAQTGRQKVLHIADFDQSHHLPVSPQLSAGFCTSPDFFEAVAEGAERLQRMLAPFKEYDAISARPNAIFARFPAHHRLIEFTEGAAIHANINCERRVHSATQSEQLVFPEAFSFDEHKIRQLMNKASADTKGLRFLERHMFERSHITKDGRFSGKSAGSGYKASRVLLFDHDLIEFEMNMTSKPHPLQGFARQVLRFQKRKRPVYAAQQDVTTGLWQYGFEQDSTLFSSIGSTGQLTAHLLKYFPEISDKRIQQMDQTAIISPTDGYPLFDVIGDRKVMCFCGAQHFEIALMPLLVDQLSGNADANAPLWHRAKVKDRQKGAGTLLQMAVGV